MENEDVDVKANQTDEQAEDKSFIDNLLNEVEEEGTDKAKEAEKGTDSEAEKEKKATEEQERRKQKDAEEARKRREAEAKAEKAEKEKADQGEGSHSQGEKKNTPDEKTESGKGKETPSEDQESKLMGQIGELRRAHPDLDLDALFKDEHFKGWVDGRLLGRKSLTELYEGYLKNTSDISGEDEETITSHLRKQTSSPGSSKSEQEGAEGIYSQKELEDLAEKMPSMSPKHISEITAKYEKSIAFYNKRK